MANKKQKSINLLPEFFRTDKNNKFLSSTIDQLIQTPELERIDGYIGSKSTLTYNSTSDVYISETSKLRKDYQLAPSLVINDENYNVKKPIGIDELTNEISLQGGITSNFDKLYSPDYYSFNPHVDWDKLVNYQEYYWLTTGPETIVVTGQPKNSTSTFTISDTGLNSAFIFTPNGVTQNPLVTLYRGNVYNFQCSSTNKFYIKTAPSLGNNDLLTFGIVNNGTTTGTITLTVDNNTPDILYYATDDEGINQGQILIKRITEDTEINVELEIVGKVNYTSGTGISLSNGMKIKFGGTVIPETYQNKEFFVEGVGSSIVLVDYESLISNQLISNQLDEDFDVSPFDEYPFDNFKRLPVNSEYITINRASKDKNPWSRYNRWVHKDIIKISSEVNNIVPTYPYEQRAKRPIIEFKADLKLYNFGSKNIGTVDLIDTTTKNAFRYVENTDGYYVDGVLLQQGHRVIFNADNDAEVKTKIYKVEFANIGGQLKLNLIEDNVNLEYSDSILINFGNQNEGTEWWFDGQQWKLSQQHTVLNESPLFDLFDNDQLSYSDQANYSSNFKGNKIFGYEEGPYYDKVLGFSINQQNSQGIGSFVFKNYFSTGEIIISKDAQTTETVPTSKTFLKIKDKFVNVWTKSETYEIPIVQFNSLEIDTNKVEINAIENPVDTIFNFEVFVKLPKNYSSIFGETISGIKKVRSSNYTTTIDSGKFYIVFDQPLPQYTDVIINLYTDSVPNNNGYYETPLGLTNNPLNDKITTFTLSDLTDHLKTIVNKVSEFSGNFPGANNLRDLEDYTKFGTRLISHKTPMAFASMFIGSQNYNVIKSIEVVADHYNSFKSLFLKKITEYTNQIDIVNGVDNILLEINQDKNIRSPYFYSDMLAYGSNKNRITIEVNNTFGNIYPISTEFDLNKLSLTSILVYKNNSQLLIGVDYKFVENDASIEFLTELEIGDVIYIDQYLTTEGCYVPPTPTKLGLYPAWKPVKFVDHTYAQGPINAIRCHDGSIIVAFDDYRDDMIIELERRIYNNIKIGYKQDLFDINSIIPGYFRNNQYNLDEINLILKRDFIKWVGLFGLDYTANNTFDVSNSKTWNFNKTWNPTLGIKLSGYWRNIYQFLYGTDSPDTSPWEMLGFTDKPNWWDDEYGPAPYTSGNSILWNDIKLGYIKQGTREGIDPLYSRPNILEILPVDEFGNAKNPDFLAINFTDSSIRENFKFGDNGPTENSWRRSSYFPFSIQRLLALTNPIIYCSLMFDVSRMEKNVAEQWVYSETKEFLNLSSIIIPNTDVLTTGYSVFVTEVGKAKNSNFIKEFKDDLKYLNFNLTHKVGGFINKNKLQVIIDAFDPTSTSPGAILPLEDYQLILNTSNPVSSVSISGIIVQKSNGKFLIKGYDKSNSYFNVFTPNRNYTTPAVTIGGISEPFVNWTAGTTGGSTGLSAAETTTAQDAVAGVFYQQGQIVAYNQQFYRVKVSHRSGTTFDPTLFTRINSLPITGGVTVQLASSYNEFATQIPYGSEFSSIQEVYDLILGYGKWLESQGFIFDSFSSEINEVLDWNLSAKEFLYWTTQNWADNSIITLSPFAYQIKFFRPLTIVDDIFNSFYEYSILQANGDPIAREKISVNRDEGICTISVSNSPDGIYFAVLNNVQKEHVMVFNNTTIFNDSIFDLKTGYRQLRMKLVGFRTKNWNGDYFSPGFIFDEATIYNWKEFKNYQYADVVKFNGKYYSAKNNIIGANTFDVNDGWILLGEKPIADLIPNFDYKIKQFEDFYSLDIDNFDQEQQKLAQHLIGYSPRTYLNNIFSNPISQYKFYQGYIREKGTKNAIQKLSKATLNNLQGELDYFEEWAFRIGNFGSYQTYNELEFPLVEGTFIENPQVINSVSVKPVRPNDLISYVEPIDFSIKPDNFEPLELFKTNTSTYFDNNFVLSTAGYVRIDDVDATAYNENSLLDIAQNQNINEGNTVWLGFKQNGDWDVLRYEKSIANIIGVFVSAPTIEITFVTDLFHDLKIGDIISVTNFNDQVNGVYTVLKIPALDRFIVSSELASIENAELLSPGQLFKFTSARLDYFDNLPNDKKLIKLPYGSKFWVDSDISNGNGKWSVYQKINNYSSFKINATSFPSNQGLGSNLYKEKDNDLLFVSAPLYSNNNNTIGRIITYLVFPEESRLIFSYPINSNPSSSIKYYESTDNTNFGQSLVYDSFEFNDSGYGLIFAGAPDAGQVRSSSPNGGLRYSTGTETASVLVQEGLLKISSVNPLLEEEQTEFVLLSPNPTNYQKFGSSIFVQKNTGSKILLVGAPGTVTTGSGAVYAYVVNSTGTDVTVQYTSSITTSSVYAGSLWGTKIVGTNNGSTVAISAPGKNSSVGFVCVYSGTNFVQTINGSDFNLQNGSKFGQNMLMSSNGNYLLIAAPEQKNIDQSFGQVIVFEKSAVTNRYVYSQTLFNPVPGAGMKFGTSLDINVNNNELVISAVGYNYSVKATFDIDLTKFDSSSTTFIGTAENSGIAYVYNRKDQRFVIADQLVPDTQINGSYYGNSVLIDNDVIYVGAPTFNSYSTSSVCFQFNKLDSTKLNWDQIRIQDDLVDLTQFQRITLIDTFNDEIVEYLDVIDPVKGKIAGIADQEIKYRTSYDPAIYSIGIAGTVNDTDVNWLDEHLGELWWDLSTVKYQWYEQGDSAFRKNNWGNLFPGATIDVYEWVGSFYLPSEWSALADTTQGLTESISGQPKYPDNSVISVKQIYNAATNSFSNYYYYWVKNKITIPNVKNRRISTYQVASLIADPVSYGYKSAFMLSADSLALCNIGQLLVDNRISLNITIDVINNSIGRHTEWLLLKEGAADSVPPPLLEKKLIDSLLGRDKLGNLVPDPSLSDRTKYGIEIRPRQTLFKDRKQALRNLIEFSNSILLKNQITGNYDFRNLEQQENYPAITSNEYDEVVEDNELLSIIETRQLRQAKLSCIIYNGKIYSVSIVDPGFGYKISPSVSVVGNSEIQAVIETVIDTNGKITGINIVNPGKGYTQVPTLTVRPYSVIVENDETYNGKWGKFVWNKDANEWERKQTQKYNTPLYWKYVDWNSVDYDQYKDYKFTVNEVYQLLTLPNLNEGDYVKVKNSGDNRYIILSKTSPGTNGTFDNDFDLVYKEQGTIQILETIWNSINGDLGFDGTKSSFDQTLYDQTPDIELSYIIGALISDIFVGELKVNWNKFFFKAVKYALSEQKLLDWAFKTSFINVVNYAGNLDQRPVYKLQNSSYYEDYLKEVKPYHTQIRSYTTNYNLVDPTQSHVTDFDLPSYYDRTTNEYNVVDINSELLLEYPWKSWVDNYTYEVGSILVGNPGANYTTPPIVEIIAVEGDLGTGAIAQAYITSGKVTEIKVLNPGKNYKKSPRVILHAPESNTLIPAVAYAVLTNKKVRTNLIGMKFDRITRTEEVTDIIVTDKFACNGSNNEFVLNWLASPNKSKIVVTLNKDYVLSSDYTIEYYTELVNGYNKKMSKIIFLNYVPESDKILSVTYEKSNQLFSAIERINNYYSPTAGMPGKDPGQLIDDFEYSKTSLLTLGFDYSPAWDYKLNDDIYVPFGTTPYADSISFYTVVTATSTLTNISNTWSSITVSATEGISIGHYVNVISTLTNVFSTTTVKVISVNSITNSVTFNNTGISFVNTGSTIEFWNYDSNSSLLDTVIEGGSLSQTGNMAALGINPEDVILDGDMFVTTNNSNILDELVPGRTADCIALNVYTKNTGGAPVIINNYFYIQPNEITYHKLSVLPTSQGSIMVIFKNRLLDYVPYDTFANVNQDSNVYTLLNDEILIGPQSTAGVVGYSVVSIGGLNYGPLPSAIDGASVTAYGSVAKIKSLSDINSVFTASVYVNGSNPIPRKPLGFHNTNTTYTSPYYELGQFDVSDQRASVTVYNLTALPTTVTAWFMGSEYSYFNEIRSEEINGNNYQLLDTSTDGSIPTYYYDLINDPKNIEPTANQVLVEINTGTGWKMLVPPVVTTYNITDTAITTYKIDPNKTWGVSDDGFTDYSNLRVYLNGRELIQTVEYILVAQNSITVTPTVLEIGDVLTILGKPNLTVDVGAYDYDIVNGQLKLVTNPANSLIKVISYTTHDNLSFKRDVFRGNPNRRFKVSNPIINDNYIWVVLNGVPLINKIDYEILDDQRTVQLSDTMHITSNDKIQVIAVGSQPLSDTVLGYRVFNDIFGRSHYKRLAKKNTTFLTQPLFFTDTEIHVNDSTVLTPPSPSKNIPGIILIDGERIEFNKIENNTLKNIRRATLGTGASKFLSINTKVIDQSPEQTIPYSDIIKKQTLFVSTTTNTYSISTSSFIVPFPNDNTNLISSDGIIFQSLPINSSIGVASPKDQIMVYYGGRPLRKEGYFYHDISVAYDSPEFTSILGTFENSNMLPSNSSFGDAYLITGTNQVWIQTNSVEVGAVNGFSYKGLNYTPPEFTLTVSSSTQTITLNVDLIDDVKLLIVKKESTVGNIWNDIVNSTETLPLFDSTTPPAKFLKEKVAELPDKYYFGGDNDLFDNGDSLLNENNEPLEGF